MKFVPIDSKHLADCFEGTQILILIELKRNRESSHFLFVWRKLRTRKIEFVLLQLTIIHLHLHFF